MSRLPDIDVDVEQSDSQPLLQSSPTSASPYRRHASESSTGSSNLQSLEGGHLHVDPVTHAYTYSYGVPGLRGLAHNSLMLKSALFASVGGLTFGYDQGVIANVLVMKEFVKVFPVGAWEKGVLTAVLELGCLVGALSSGFLADKLSRRHSIFLACVVFIVGSTIQVVANSVKLLTVGRAIGGLGVGALSTLSPLYITEISSPELRGSLLALEQFSIVLGCVLGFWVGFWTRNVPSALSFRLPLLLQLVPGTILALGIFTLPPSPRLLVMHGKIEQARSVLSRLRRRSPGDYLVELELLEIQTEATLIKETEGKGRNTGSLKGWGELFGKDYRRRTLIGMGVAAFQQWTGINALLYYGPSLLASFGLAGPVKAAVSARADQPAGTDNATLMVSGGIGIVQFFAVVPTIVWIDRWGRRPLLRGGAVIMSLSHFIIALVIYECSDDWSHHRLAAWAAVFCVYLFTASYGISYGPVGWILPNEIFPLSIRSKGVAISTASVWFNNFAIGLLTPVFIDVSPAGTFLIFSIAAFLAYLWSTYLVPETANVSLEEMDEIFESSKGKEDAGLKERIEEGLGLRELIRELSRAQTQEGGD